MISFPANSFNSDNRYNNQLTSKMDSSTPEAKRAKLDLTQTQQDSGVSGTSSSKSTEAETEIIFNWKLSDFIKVNEGLEGKDFERYKSPVKKFKDLNWSIEIRPKLHPRHHSLHYPTHSSKNAKVMMECVLQAENTDEANEEDNTDEANEEDDSDEANEEVDTDESNEEDDDTEKFDCIISLATSSKQRNSSKEVKFLEFPNGYKYTVDVQPGAIKPIFKWSELKDSYNFRSSSEDYIKVTLTFVDADMTSDENQAKFFQLQQYLIAQMKKEAKGIQLYFSIQAQMNEGKENGLEEDFWIEAKCGTRVGFHKGILRVRGNDHIKSYLSSGMKESLTSELKWDIFDLDIILGFKEYLYYGTVPNLKTRAIEYFKFGDYCHLDKVKELAELELCRNGSMDECHELTKYYPTKYLKEEIIKNWKKDPKYMEQIIAKQM